MLNCTDLIAQNLLNSRPQKDVLDMNGTPSDL